MCTAWNPLWDNHLFIWDCCLRIIFLWGLWDIAAQDPCIQHPRWISTDQHPGLDLQGNTYWEFHDVRGDDPAGTRWRRIVQYPRSTHYGDVKPSPQWHSWLRHLRESPPSIQEQHAEARRQHQIKYLAAQADARWEAKPRLVDAPGDGETGQPVPALRGTSGRTMRGSDGESDGVDVREETRTGAVAVAGVSPGEVQQGQMEEEPARKQKVDPWKHHRRAGPSEDWQPKAWTPPPSKR